MTVLYRAASVPLLCKPGSCIVKPQRATRRIPSLKAYFCLVLVLRHFPKLILGGPTAEDSCRIKGQPREDLANQSRTCSPSASSTGPEPGDSVSPPLPKLKTWHPHVSRIAPYAKIRNLVTPSILTGHNLWLLPPAQAPWKEGGTDAICPFHIQHVPKAMIVFFNKRKQSDHLLLFRFLATSTIDSRLTQMCLLGLQCVKLR